MRVSASRLLACLCALGAPLLAAADANPFNIPAGGLSAKGGEALDLTWTPTTSGTVTLVLRSGSSSNLDEGTVIASKIANSGSFTWTPSNTLTSGSDYAVEIVDDDDPTQTNYTPQFALDTTDTKATTTSVVTFGPPTVTLTTSASSSSGSTGIVTTSLNTTSLTFTIHNTFTHATASSGNSASLTTLTGKSSSASPAATSTSSTAGAARATALAGGIIGLALGALAL